MMGELTMHDENIALKCALRRQAHQAHSDNLNWIEQASTKHALSAHAGVIAKLSAVGVQVDLDKFELDKKEPMKARYALRNPDSQSAQAAAIECLLQAGFKVMRLSGTESAPQRFVLCMRAPDDPVITLPVTLDCSAG
ncbi:hypothetical protein V8J88_03970 [Massilia sp. W12]|uniref:hypothetical protein n=1 Tax=Massilia sp. W12 TaxID=3126507 RepID=UPI0030D37039